MFKTILHMWTPFLIRVQLVYDAVKCRASCSAVT